MGPGDAPADAEAPATRKPSRTPSVTEVMSQLGDFEHAPKQTKDVLLWVNMALVVLLGACNTVARKVALVPLGNYTVFFSEFTSASYTVTYLCILTFLYRRGTVSADQLRYPWSRAGLPKFVLLGALDALADILGNAGIEGLPGELVPLLSKVLIPFVMIASIVLLGERYVRGEYLGAGIVLVGAVVALIPDMESSDDDDDDGSNSVPVFNLVIYIVSVVPSAVSFVVKEKIFRDWKDLNVFVVSGLGSLWQLVFSFLSLPLDTLPALGGDSISELPAEVSNGARCFGGVDSSDDDDCSGAPLAPLIYMTINIFWNIALIVLLKRGGATLTFVTNTISFPLSAMAFLISWPLLGASAFSWFYLLGLAVEMSGVVQYRLSGMRKEAAAAADKEDPLRMSLLSSRPAGSEDGSLADDTSINF